MIIETSSNRFYRVVEIENPDLAHCWMGIEVKRVRGEFVPKKNAYSELVRKAATRVVEA